jgi:uncharacterized membrane protein
MLLARGAHEMALGAFLLAFTNMVAIQFASSVVFWLAGYGQSRRFWAAGYRALVRNLVSVALLLVLGTILGISTHRAVQKQLFETRVRETLEDRLQAFPGAYLAGARFERDVDHGIIVRAVVESPNRLSAADVGALELALPPAPGGGRARLRVREVLVEVLTRDDVSPGGPRVPGASASGAASR